MYRALRLSGDKKNISYDAPENQGGKNLTPGKLYQKDINSQQDII